MLPLDVKAVSKTLLATLFIRSFGLRKIPILFYLRPTVAHWDDERVVIKIPLRRRSKNHLGSMYFGALAAGADLAVGFVAMDAIRQSGERIALIFKNMQADFLKRAEGDVHFACDDGILIRDLVQKAIETGERVELSVPVVATCPKETGDEPVAKFTMTLSLKKKDEQTASSGEKAHA